jgi:putative transposase
MKKYMNRYRIPSARAPWFDYGLNGAYLVTICTANREHFFGDISDGNLNANELGLIASKVWKEIPTHFPYARLGEFVVMPNHVHGILKIDKRGHSGSNHVDSENVVVNRWRFSAKQSLASKPVERGDFVRTSSGGFAGAKNPMLNDNLSRVMRWYKGRCTYEMRKIHADFKWQTNYHERIIPSKKAYEKIELYIKNNPKAWDRDSFRKPKRN